LDRLNEFTSIVRKGVEEFSMIDAGDLITVGVSGGKDSLVLLRALAHLRSYYPKPFELSALTLDLGFEGMDFSGVERLCREIDVPYAVIRTDIREIVFDIRREENPCSLCAKMRRGALNSAIKESDSNKLALGHHSDDAIETLLMSLIFEGRISCFKPVTYMSRAGVYQIRPMIYANEAQVEALCRYLALPVVASTCPMDKESKRNEIKKLLSSLEASYPDIKSKLFGAMKRLPLPGWGPDSEAGQAEL
jgi:tRNA(Ile)-lysidine synthase TilS/MesJ